MSTLAESIWNELYKEGKFNDTWLWDCIPVPPLLFCMTVSESRTSMCFTDIAHPDSQVQHLSRRLVASSAYVYRM